MEVSIGAEHDPRLSDLSVVTAAYSKGAMPIGSLGVVGPIRMDYERVIALVDYTAKALSRVLVAKPHPRTSWPGSASLG